MTTEYKATAPCDVCTRKHLSCAMSYAIFAHALSAEAPKGLTPPTASLALAGGVGWARAIINLTESLNHDASLLTLAIQGLTQYVDAARILALRVGPLEGLPSVLTDDKRYQAARLRRALFNSYETTARDSWTKPVLETLEELFDYSTDVPETNFHNAVFFCVAHLLEAVREHPDEYDDAELKALADLISQAYVQVGEPYWLAKLRDALLQVALSIQAQVDIAMMGATPAKEEDNVNV